MKRIVVGVDGSEASQAALAWAVEEARLRGAEVDAVTVCSYLAFAAGFASPLTQGRDELGQAKAVLDRACDAVKTDVTINRLLEEGLPVPALLSTAQDADLLVVGSRGWGGFTGLMLGSGSQQVAAHAPCPVVIVR
jgi:nucleotide-binding universal stress UspA family protein